MSDLGATPALEPETASITAPLEDGAINGNDSALPVNRNLVKPEDILKGISGAWSSTCRDMDSKKANSSEKDVVIINIDDKKTSLIIHTLQYSGSRSCEKKYFQDLEENSFSLNNAQDGHSEHEQALALDLVDPKIKTEAAQNVLLVFASPDNSELKARILFEVLDTQRTAIRMQIQEWKHLLPSRLQDHDTVILQLESILNEGGAGKRSIHYTKSQAFSRSSPEDLALIND